MIYLLYSGVSLAVRASHLDHRRCNKVKGLSHGQKCRHLFPDSEAYHEQYPAQMEA